MRSSISRKEWLSELQVIDKIHPEHYNIDPNDQSRIEVDTFLPDFTDPQPPESTKKVTDIAGLSAENVEPEVWQPPMVHNAKRVELQAKIRKSQREIHQKLVAVNATIDHRTQAHNRKCDSKTIEEERASRAEAVSAQLNAWRSVLPGLLKKFAKIPDPRKAGSVQHKLVVLMVFGLFSFIFRLTSRREMNRELTSPMVQANLKKIFPELDSIPHADTLARLLERINPLEIEKAHVDLVKSLIRNKKFKKLLINGCLPITIDGTQKLYRDGLLNDGRWCERTVGNKDNPGKQQYVYVVEANITLQNGLTIPLLTEYLFRDNNASTNPEGKEDCEIVAFDRLSARLKEYFPRLNIILFLDSLYATQGVMDACYKNNWEYLIRLPRRKLTDLAKTLATRKHDKMEIPGQPYYRERRQEFYFQNNISYGDEEELAIHLVACLERYEKVNKLTGEIKVHYSDHAWISSIKISMYNVHELCNLGARRKELIEDSFNTEKNRGYHYKHAYSYNWYAMQGFHYLMRLAHAINAISEFSKKLKKYVKEKGCGATLKLIKETLFSPWLSTEWYESQLLEVPQLRLQLE